MSQSKSIGIFILVALIAAATALAIDRSLFWPSPDRIELEIQNLKAQLAESQATRDALNLELAQRDDSLNTLRSAATLLADNLNELQARIETQDARLRELRQQPIRYEQPNDSLLHDLNAIVLMLQSGEGAINPGR